MLLCCHERACGCRKCSPPPPSAACPQVQQSVLANLPAGAEQEASQTLDALPRGLVTVIAAQDARTPGLCGADGRPPAASMLQVRKACRGNRLLTSADPCIRGLHWDHRIEVDVSRVAVGGSA